MHTVFNFRQFIPTSFFYLMLQVQDQRQYHLLMNQMEAASNLLLNCWVLYSQWCPVLQFWLYFKPFLVLYFIVNHCYRNIYVLYYMILEYVLEARLASSYYYFWAVNLLLVCIDWNKNVTFFLFQYVFIYSYL